MKDALKLHKENSRYNLNFRMIDKFNISPDMTDETLKAASVSAPELLTSIISVFADLDFEEFIRDHPECIAKRKEVLSAETK